MRTHSLRWPAALLAALALAGCPHPTAPPPQSPVDAAEAFARALQEGDAAGAWSLLSARTQQQADQLAARARLTPDGGPESGRAMLFGGAFPLGSPDARELSRTGDRAELASALDGGAEVRFAAVREGPGWKLDLELAVALPASAPAAAPAPPSTAPPIPAAPAAKP